jgi:predicted nucleotidyltransferase
MKGEDFLKKIKYAVLSVDGDAEIILFGSRARGDHKKDSDWDILILTNKEEDVNLKNSILDKVFDLELEHTQAISTMIVDKQTWEDWAVMPLYKNIAKEGIAL